MDIRPAEHRDIPGMTALLLQVCEVHHQIRPDIFRPGALKYSETELESLLQDENRPIFVAEEHGFIAGYCFCALRCYDGTGVSTCRTELYIDDFCVDEGFRGKGVAASLYEYACDFARQQGCQFVTLNVWCGNERAMAFYEKSGLRPRNITMEMPLEEWSC